MALPKNVTKFIDRYLPAAIEAERKDGINVIFSLAQTGIESGYGEKKVGTNNLHGVKAELSDPKKVLSLTREVLPKSKKSHYQEYFSSNGRKIKSVTSYSSTHDEWYVYDWFKDYDSASGSFNDRGKVILNLTKLTPEQARKKSAYEMAKLVAASGYATGQNYNSLLNSVIGSINAYVTEKLATIQPEKKNPDGTGLMLAGSFLLAALIIPGSSSNKKQQLGGISSTELLITSLMLGATAFVLLSKNLFMNDEKISKHITLAQVMASETAKARGLDNTPGETEKANAKALAENVLDKVIDHFGEIVISSFYRAPKVNAAVGGSASSQHKYAQAADISAPPGASYTNADIYKFIQNTLKYDQLIWEFGTDKQPKWVHVSFSLVRNRKQGLKAVATGSGTQYLNYYA